MLIALAAAAVILLYGIANLTYQIRGYAREMHAMMAEARAASEGLKQQRDANRNLSAVRRGKKIPESWSEAVVESFASRQDVGR